MKENLRDVYLMWEISAMSRDLQGRAVLPLWDRASKASKSMMKPRTPPCYASDVLVQGARSGG